MSSILKRTIAFAVMLSICASFAGCGSEQESKDGATVSKPSGSLSETKANSDTDAKAAESVSKADTAADAKAAEKEATEVITLENLKAIPEFKCKDVDGNEVSSDIFKDSKLTLINLWGTWCSPCVAELPDLEEVYKEAKEKGFNVVGVVEDGMKNEDSVKEVLDKTKVTYTNIIPDEKFYDDFMSLCNSFPASLLVDSNGKVVGELIIGARSKKEYMKLFDEALKKLK